MKRVKARIAFATPALFPATEATGGISSAKDQPRAHLSIYETGRATKPDTSMIAFKWAKSLSIHVQQSLLAGDVKRLQAMIDAAVATPASHVDEEGIAEVERIRARRKEVYALSYADLEERSNESIDCLLTAYDELCAQLALKEQATPAGQGSESQVIADELARIVKWARDNEPITASQIVEVLRNREGVNRIAAIRRSRATESAPQEPTPADRVEGEQQDAELG